MGSTRRVKHTANGKAHKLETKLAHNHKRSAPRARTVGVVRAEDTPESLAEREGLTIEQAEDMVRMRDKLNRASDTNRETLKNMARPAERMRNKRCLPKNRDAPSHVPVGVWNAAREAYDEACAKMKEHGAKPMQSYRYDPNAQHVHQFYDL